MKTPRVQLLPDLPPSSSTTHPSRVPSPDAPPTLTPNTKITDQPTEAVAAEKVNETDHDSDTRPLATVTVDPSGSVIARASSSGKLTAVATTETTEVTTTTEVMEIASTPPKRTKTTTTEKKTLTTAKVIPDELAGLKNEQSQTIPGPFQETVDVKEEERQGARNFGQDIRKKDASATYCVEETRHSVQTSVGDRDEDVFVLRSGRTEQEEEPVKERLCHKRQSQSEQGTSSNKTEIKEREEAVSATPPENAECASSTNAKQVVDARTADPKKPSGRGQRSLLKGPDTLPKPSSSRAGVSETGAASKEEKNTAKEPSGDGIRDDKNPFVSYSNSRRFSAAANLEWHRTTAGNEGTVTKLTTAAGWRSKLGKLYASNDDDEWVQKRRRGRSPSVSAVLESKEKEQTANNKFSEATDRGVDKSKSKDEHELSPPEDKLARRRRFFESKSSNQQKDNSSPTSQQTGRMSARSRTIASARGNDIASLKKDTSPKLQLKSHVETRIPSSRLLGDRKSETTATTGSVDVASDSSSKPADGSEEKTMRLFDSLSTQRQKFEAEAKKTASSPSLSHKDPHTKLGVLQSSNSEKLFVRQSRPFEEPRTVEQGSDMQAYTGTSAQPAQTGCGVNKEQQVSSGVPTQERTTDQLAQKQANDMTSSVRQEQPCSDDGTQRRVPVSGSKDVYTEKRKFFEDQREEIEQTSSPSSALLRSKSFQLRSSWLSSERNASQSVKDTTVATNVSDRQTSLHEAAARHSPTPWRSSPRLGRRSPRSGRSSPKSVICHVVDRVLLIVLILQISKREVEATGSRTGAD